MSVIMYEKTRTVLVSNVCASDLPLRGSGRTSETRITYPVRLIRLIRLTRASTSPFDQDMARLDQSKSRYKVLEFDP
jgi:hypothetical protein